MSIKKRGRVRRTTLLLAFCIALLVGIKASPVVLDVHPSLWAVVSVVLLFFARRSSIALLTIFILVGLLLGIGRGGVYAEKRAEYDPLYYQKITLTARAMNDATYGPTKQLTFDATDVTVDGHELTGKIKLSGFGINAIFEGDEVVATGKLYPILGASQGRMSYAVLKLVDHHPSHIGVLRRNFTAGVRNALPEPLDSFAMGLLIGQRATLPPDIKEALLMVGLTHIIAVSGYNLTIMLRASKRLFAGRSKRLTALLSLLLIGLFLLLAGSSASIVRAAIVSVLSIWASYYGRDFRPVLLILLAAAVTAYANPFYVWSDAGWYLSFLAFAGVMILAPLLATRFPKRVQHSVIAMVALESFCAEVATLPYLLHTFGQMSLIGLVANVLVVGLVPLAMLFGLIAGIVGMLAPAVAGWVAWPGVLLLTYMLDTAQLLSKIPHIFQKDLALSTTHMIILYSAIVGFCWSLNFKNRQKEGIITDENVVPLPIFERMHNV